MIPAAMENVSMSFDDALCAPVTEVHFLHVPTHAVYMYINTYSLNIYYTIGSYKYTVDVLNEIFKNNYRLTLTLELLHYDAVPSGTF